MIKGVLLGAKWSSAGYIAPVDGLNRNSYFAGSGVSLVAVLLPLRPRRPRRPGPPSPGPQGDSQKNLGVRITKLTALKVPGTDKKLPKVSLDYSKMADSLPV